MVAGNPCNLKLILNKEMQMTTPTVKWSDSGVFTFDCYGALSDLHSLVRLINS